MITVKFPNGRRVRAIIIDKPFNGVSGIVECCDCEWRAVITAEETSGQAEEIEIFAYSHTCQRLPTKQDLLDAITRAKQHKGGKDEV